MPYTSLSQIPDAVKNSLPEPDQERWMKSFNAYESTADKDDTGAARVAWSQVRKNARWFAGYASVEVLDKQNDIVSIDAFKKNITQFMQRGAPIIDQHSNRQVGTWIDYDFRNKNGTPALWVEGVIYKGYAVDDEVWDKIKKGEYSGLSIGAEPTQEGKECNGGGECYRRIKEIQTFEISPVTTPACPEATIEEVNHLVKSDNDKDNFINKSRTEISSMETSQGCKCNKITKDKGDQMTEVNPEETIKKEAIAPESAPAGDGGNGGNGIGEVKAMMEKMLSMMQQLTGNTQKAAETIPTPAAVEVKKEDLDAMVQKAVDEKLKALTEGKPAATPRPGIQKMDGVEVPRSLGRMKVDELWAAIEPASEERPW